MGADGEWKGSCNLTTIVAWIALNLILFATCFHIPEAEFSQRYSWLCCGKMTRRTASWPTSSRRWKWWRWLVAIATFSTSSAAVHKMVRLLHSFLLTSHCASCCCAPIRIFIYLLTYLLHGSITYHTDKLVRSTHCRECCIEPVIEASLLIIKISRY